MRGILVILLGMSAISPGMQAKPKEPTLVVKVSDYEGKKIAGVRVGLLNLTTHKVFRIPETPIHHPRDPSREFERNDLTNAEGECAVPGVPPGKYRVKIFNPSDDWNIDTIPFMRAQGKEPDAKALKEIIMTYEKYALLHGGEIWRDVEIKEDQKSQTCEIVLQQPASIEGRITYEDGTIIEDALWVSIGSTDGWGSRVIVEKDGVYKLMGLNPADTGDNIEIYVSYKQKYDITYLHKDVPTNAGKVTSRDYRLRKVNFGITSLEGSIFLEGIPFTMENVKTNSDKWVKEYGGGSTLALCPSISIRNEEENIRYSLSLLLDGKYTFFDLPPGQYFLDVSTYKNMRQRLCNTVPIEIKEEQTKRVDINMIFQGDGKVELIER